MQGHNLLAPGPVKLHPKVMATLALPMIHHRTPEFDSILKRTLQRLKLVFQTEQDCFALTATGSGGMEALLVNTIAPKDKLIVVDSGKFGERWAEMAKIYGAEVITLKVPWGKTAAIADIEALLKLHPDCKALMTQACETSTGVKHPIEQMGQLVAKMPHCLFLVDGITALGAFPLPMDKWHIDGLVGGSQKAFMLPTGLTLLSFSKKAWQQIESNPQPRFYFDIRKEQKANKNGETFFSSNVTLIRALDVVLEMIEQQGLPALFKEISERAEWTKKMALEMGFRLYAETPAESVTALLVPEGYDGQKIRAELETKHGITIMGGQDQAKGKIIRIGHMGFIEKQDLIDLQSGLQKTLLAQKEK